MSALNGDKARFNRQRKGKLARRERSQVLRKKMKSYSPAHELLLTLAYIRNDRARENSRYVGAA